MPVRVLRRFLRAVVLAELAGPLVIASRRALPAQEVPSSAASLTGRVSDARSDSALSNAYVIVSGTLLRTTTDSRGRYTLRGIAPGRYAVRVLLLGYESEVRVVQLAPGEERHEDFPLVAAPLQLAPVTVTANRAASTIGDVPASQAVLGRDEIVHRNVITLDQALAYVPGVIFNHGDVDIRGSTGVAGGVGSRVLMLLDGHPILSADGGEVDFSSIPLLDIDRVEIVKGAYSALYGSNALGGVVNIITSPIGETPETIGEAHYGAYDQPAAYRFTDHRLDFKGFELQHSRRLGDVGLRLFADRETSDGFRQDDASSRWVLRAKAELPEHDAHPATFSVVWSSQDDGNFFMWDSASHPTQAPPATLNDRAHSDKLSAGATITPLARETMRLQVDPWVERDATRNTFPSDSDYHFHRATAAGATVQLTMAPSVSQTLTFGAAGSHTVVTSDILGRPLLDDGGVYAQDELALPARVTASVGARLDAHHASGSRTEARLNPKLGVAWHVGTHTTLRISSARGYRAPSAIEQFVNSSQSGIPVIPNPDLHGETAWSTEVGVIERPVHWLWMDGALFRSDYHGLIGPGTVPGRPLVFQFRNLQRARVQGLDLATKLALVPDLASLQVNYTWLDAKDLDTGLPLPYRSAHNLTTSLDLLGGLAGVDVRWRSRVQQVLLFPLDPRGAITVVDLRAGYRVLGSIVQLRVSNLLQEKYVDVMERTPGPPRSVMVAARRTF